jgi:nucleoside-diphosphate-sugar epimerase
VYASSVGAYSHGPKDHRVDESWATAGIATSTYSRQKAYVERRLDRFEREASHVRVVRLRKALVFKREASSEIRRLFLGPLFPSVLLRRGRAPIVPDIDRLRFQAVHSYDAGEAYRLALRSDVRGAFNIAAEPVLDPAELSRILGGRRIRVRAAWLRAILAVTWRMRLQPTEPGWLDLALGTPLMNVSRARTILGWQARRTSGDALRDLIVGLGDGAGIDTPPLAAGSAVLRLRQFPTGARGR